MKKLLALLLLATVSFAANAAENPDPKAMKETAMAVAQEMPLEKQVDDLAEGIAQTLPENKRPLFKSILKKNVDVPALRVAATQALVKTYTFEELTTMKENKTQPGTDAMIGKVEQFTKEMQPTIDTMVNKAVTESRKAGLFPAQTQMK